ncbi:MAG: ADP-ribosylglycohydrolase family protein [Firmicutes bacterium]|nr:ADP-ribosylglycohydrolase family protein [Bacillota bacterium]
MALLYGNKDFGKTICLAVQAAFDTDCDGATVGSILGMMLGQKGILPCWYECYNLNLSTTIVDYTKVTVQQLVDKTLQLLQSTEK